MVEERIKHKELWESLSNIKKKEIWIDAAKRLKLNITQPKGGSSHYAIRLPGYENYDVRGLISNVYDPVRKDISESIFKRLLDKGFTEDDIWRALKIIK